MFRDATPPAVANALPTKSALPKPSSKLASTWPVENDAPRLGMGTDQAEPFQRCERQSKTDPSDERKLTYPVPTSSRR